MHYWHPKYLMPVNLDISSFQINNKALIGFWGTGELGIYFRGTGIKDNIVRGENRFSIFGEQGKKSINFREQGNRYTPWRASLIICNCCGDIPDCGMQQK